MIQNDVFEKNGNYSYCQVNFIVKLKQANKNENILVYISPKKVGILALNLLFIYTDLKNNG